MSKVRFQYADSGLSLANKTAIKDFVARLFSKEGKRLASISYIFCTDAFLLDINRQFLQHDYYTDIITFGLSEPGNPIEAEIYISTDRVRDNARTEGVLFKDEMLRVILHGALHLCGYKDKTRVQRTEMRNMENRYMQMYYKNG